LNFSCNKAEEIMVYDVAEIFKPPGFLFDLANEENYSQTVNEYIK